MRLMVTMHESSREAHVNHMFSQGQYLVHTNDSYIHVNSVNKTRQIKAPTLKDNSFFLKSKNELPQMGFKPTAFCILSRRFTN